MNTIDAPLMRGMLESGLACLRRHEAEINDMNVFPVADGDTGTNMRLTLENSLRTAGNASPLGTYLARLSEGALLGARGNSGVILSQLIKGLADTLPDAAGADVPALCRGLGGAYKRAYATVAHPVEGTILTVTREGVEAVALTVTDETTPESFLAAYLAQMRAVLARTPELLPALREAGVVDSGAMGWIVIVDGMHRFLTGEADADVRIADDRIDTRPDAAAQSAPDYDSFGSDSPFVEGYCTEFLLRLMNGPDYAHPFSVDRFTEELSALGTSLVVVADGSRVRIHVHTHRPEAVIAAARRYGEFLTFKLENMQLQHNEQLTRNEKAAGVTPAPAAPKPGAPRLPLAVIPVVDGDGLRAFFTELGCESVINGGPSMNVPASTFLDACERVNADRLVILPNNKNTVSAARQAAALYKGGKQITILPTSGIVQGYCAVAMDVTDSTDTNFRINQMRAGMEGTLAVSVAVSSKDYERGGVTVRRGQPVAVIEDEVVYASDDETDTVLHALSLLPDADEKETCLIFRGRQTTEEEAEALASAIAEARPALDVNVIDGGQTVWRWLIGLM